MSNPNLQKILVTTPFDQAGLEILRGSAELDIRPGLSPNELESIIGEYHALIVRHAKEACTKTAPLCRGCVLLEVCPTGRGEVLAEDQVS